MSQLNEFDICRASTNTLLDELMKEVRWLRDFNNQRAPRRTSPAALPAAPTAPLPDPAPPAAPPQTSPPAQKLCAQTTPELPPQPIPTPVPARSCPPSPSVEAIEEVEEKQVYKIPLRNVKQMRQKLRAQTVPRICVAEFFENYIGWPPKFGGIDMRFSRDEDPDAWYTTMLNHKQKLYRIGFSSMQLDATIFLAI